MTFGTKPFRTTTPQPPPQEFVERVVSFEVRPDLRVFGLRFICFRAARRTHPHA